MNEDSLMVVHVFYEKLPHDCVSLSPQIFFRISLRPEL